MPPRAFVPEASAQTETPLLIPNSSSQDSKWGEERRTKELEDRTRARRFPRLGAAAFPRGRSRPIGAAFTSPASPGRRLLLLRAAARALGSRRAPAIVAVAAVTAAAGALSLRRLQPPAGPLRSRRRAPA